MNKIYAIARHTFQASLRGIASAFAVLFLFIGCLLIFLFVEGDNTAAGVMRVLMSWVFGFTAAFLMALLLYLAPRTLGNELVEKQYTVLDVKPIRRSQVLLGKWLGLSLLTALLLLGVGVPTYLTLLWNGRAPVVSGAQSDEPRSANSRTGAKSIALPQDEHARMLSSRESVPAQFFLPKVEAARVRQALAERLDEREIEQAVAEHLSRLEASRLFTVEKGAERTVHFKTTAGVIAGQDATLRFKFYGTSGEEPVLHVQHQWTVRNPETGEKWSKELESRWGTYGALHFPVSLISSDGQVEVTIRNVTELEEDDEPARILLPSHTALELLIPSGSFTMNFLRALVLLWIRLVMLAGIGLAASTFMQPSVATFLLFGVVIAGSLNSFVYRVTLPRANVAKMVQEASEAESPEAGVDNESSGKHESHETHDHSHGDHSHHGHDHGATEGQVHPAARLVMEAQRFVRRRVLPVLLRLVPDFEATNPAPDLIVGRRIGWTRLTGQALLDIGVRSGLFILCGWFLFARKEVGLPYSS